MRELVVVTSTSIMHTRHAQHYALFNSEALCIIDKEEEDSYDNYLLCFLMVLNVKRLNC